MSTSAPDPLMGFAELAAELVGRAVAASVAVEPEPGSQDEAPVVLKVIIELSQTASAPGELVFKVTDEGVGLPQRIRSLCKALAPLERALGSPAVHDGALKLRTTGATETEVRRYQIMGLASGGVDAVAAPTAPKPPGLRLSGTQVTATLDSSLLPLAAEVCDQLLSVLRVMCPPVTLELRCQDLFIHPASREGDSAADSVETTLHLPTPTTSFTRLLSPLLSGASHTPIQRLKHGLLQEFQPPPPAAADAGSPPLPPPPPPPLIFIAVGESPLPRGCKWGAVAGVVLQMPDHAALAAAAAAAAAGGGPSSPPAAAEDGERLPASALVLANYSLQMSSNTAIAAALQRCDWAGHGFRLATSAAASPPPGLFHLALRCEQPGSGATISLVAVRLYPLPPQEGTAAAAAPPPPPAPRHEAQLVRGAVDAALAELRQLCPAVVAGRRDRSLARALPVVAAAAAGILRRAVDGAAAGQACAALGVGPQDLEATLLQRLGEAVAAAEGVASQG